MIIREANIGKFGKLENQKYQFAPQINVIYGANESGKSTLMQFLKAMLFGLEKTRVRKTLDTYNRYEPWDTPAYFYGSMMFETGQQQFLLERNFYYKEKRARLVATLIFIREAFGYKEPLFPQEMLDKFMQQKLEAHRTK